MCVFDTDFDMRLEGHQQSPDFHMSFNHFDKNRTRILDLKEFQACLISLGCNIRDTRQVNTIAKAKKVFVSGFLTDLNFLDRPNKVFVIFQFIDFGVEIEATHTIVGLYYFVFEV